MAYVIYKQVWQFLGTVEYPTPRGCCPLCGYAAAITTIHHCGVADAVITWREDAKTDPDLPRRQEATPTTPE